MPHYLHALFNPSSVAVVGVSATQDRPGNQVLRGLVEGGFEGRIYSVGSGTGHESISRAYASVADLPESPDVVFAAVGARNIPETMLASARAGAKFGIVFTAGFAEMSDEGAATERQMVEECRELGMRIVGPNCMGVFNSAQRLNVSEVESYPIGNIGFATQSGNIALSMFNDAPRFGLGFSSFVSFGNQADIPVSDYLEYMGGESGTDAILLYVESLPEGLGSDFVRVCSEVSRQKPIVVIKGGITEAGRRAAESHTARLSASADLYSAAFRQGGVIEVDDLDHALPALEALVRCPPLQSDRIAVVGSGGGHSTVATDYLQLAGLAVPEFSPEVQEQVAEILPAWAPRRNPIDMTGLFVEDLELFPRLTSIALSDESFGGVLSYGLYGGTWNQDLVDKNGQTYLSAAHQLGELQAKINQPIVFYSPFAANGSDVFKRMREFGVPSFASIGAAAAALGALHRHSYLQRAESRQVAGDVSAPNDLLNVVGGTLTEAQSLSILADAGIATVKQEVCDTDELLLAAAERVGYPCVLKAQLPSVAHKSDFGAVALGLNSGEEVLREAARMREFASERIAGFARCEFTVSQQLSARREIMVGVRKDPTFGHVAVLGLGGVTVEIANRTLVLVLPADEVDIRTAIEDAELEAAFGDWRGEPAITSAHLAGIIGKAHRLMVANPTLESIDINPMLQVGSKLIAVDASMHVIDRPGGVLSSDENELTAAQVGGASR